MEQLTNVFSHIFKFRFWYISGVSILALLANWYMFNSSLGSARAAATTKLEGKVRDINAVIGLSTSVGETGEPIKVHPNESTQKGMTDEISKSTTSLIEAWKLRRQAQMGIFVWPSEIIGSEKFINEFSQYDPPEKFDKIPDNSEVNGYCLLYFQHIQERMPGICDLIRAKWAYDVEKEGTPEKPPATEGDAERPEGQDAAGSGTEGAATTEGDGPADPPPATGGDPASPPTSTDEPGLKLAKPETVQWNRVNQQLWQTKLTFFKGIDGCKTTFPTGYQVLALQQDLWLLEAMFKVVAEVNGDTLANDLAKIKQIHHVVFGREARAQLGTVMVPDARLSGVQAPRVDDTSGLIVPDRAAEEGGFNTGVPAEMEKLLPFHGRYVDENFQPIDIAKLFGILSSPTPPTENLELIVAKRVPFRIAMKMSEAAIPEFIAACGNSPFEFEIAQMRINRHEPNQGIAFRGLAAGAQGTQGDSPFGSSTAGGSDLHSSIPKGAPVVETRINDNVSVEFYGIVRIYNPVDEERIKAVAGLVGGEGT